jgi:hypothetical protein
MLSPKVAAVAEARGLLLQQVQDMISNMELTCKEDGQVEQLQQQGTGSGAGGSAGAVRSVSKSRGSTSGGWGCTAGGEGKGSQLAVKVSEHLRLSDGQNGDQSGRIPASWTGESNTTKRS